MQHERGALLLGLFLHIREKAGGYIAIEMY
jgi:hypothetical protein